MNGIEVKTENDVHTVYRVDNDINGNPRYVIHFLALGLNKYEASKKTRSAGLCKYRAKWFGGGFVFQSYNVKDSIMKFENIFNL